MENACRGESISGRTGGVVTRGTDGGCGVRFEGELGAHPQSTAGRGIGQDLDLGEPLMFRGGGGNRTRLGESFLCEYYGMMREGKGYERK